MDNTTATATGCKRCKGTVRCRVHHAARMAELHAAASRIVAGGTCPDCGTRLVRNSAMAGWWQCGAYGAETHRQPAYRGLPACIFQTFTE